LLLGVGDASSEPGSSVCANAAIVVCPGAKAGTAFVGGVTGGALDATTAFSWLVLVSVKKLAVGFAAAGATAAASLQLCKSGSSGMTDRYAFSKIGSETDE
jgi:hypothetical protein